MPELRPNGPGQDRRLCQCGACGAFFAAVSVFDKHRIGPYDGERRCLTPAEMQARNLVLRESGVWGMPGPPEGRKLWATVVEAEHE
jgi:hypothetical protein